MVHFVNQRMLQRKRHLSLLLLTLLQCTWKCQVISEKIPVLRPLNFLREKEEACFLVALFRNVMYAVHLKRFIYLFAFLCVCVLNTCMSMIVMCVSCAGACPLHVHRRPLYSLCIPLILMQELFLPVGLPFPRPGWNPASPRHPPISAPHGTGAKGLHSPLSLCHEY